MLIIFCHDGGFLKNDSSVNFSVYRQSLSLLVKKLIFLHEVKQFCAKMADLVKKVKLKTKN
jgi:hypothetical protein